MTPYQQGIAHYQAGDYQAGLTSFTEAIRLDLKPIDAAYYERSKCYEALGQMDAAKADLAHMLTLSIDEARRKEVTGLIALLDEAAIKPLSKPDKIPLGFEVIENKAVFTINFVLSTEIKIIITLDAQNLGVTQEPRPLFNFAPIEVPRSSIGQIICRRESTPGPLEPAKESFVLRTDNDTLLIKRVDYAQIRYIQWLLRHQLHLLDTPQSGEYVPAKTGTAYDYKPIRKLGSYEALCGLLIAIFLTLLVIFGGASIINQYNETRQLQLSPQYTLALVTHQEINKGKYTTYLIEYQYTVLQSDGEEQLLVDTDDVAENIYHKIGNSVEIIYATSNPTISRVAADFDPWYDYFLMAFGVGLISSFVYLGVVTFMVKHVMGMWWVQQIEDEGRITQGVVSYKNYWTWESRGTNHVYDVYYRYYGYEAIVNSEETFKQFQVGDTIKVAYLPHKPHISTPLL